MEGGRHQYAPSVCLNDLAGVRPQSGARDQRSIVREPGAARNRGHKVTDLPPNPAALCPPPRCRAGSRRHRSGQSGPRFRLPSLRHVPPGGLQTDSRAWVSVVAIVSGCATNARNYLFCPGRSLCEPWFSGSPPAGHADIGNAKRGAVEITAPLFLRFLSCAVSWACDGGAGQPDRQARRSAGNPPQEPGSARRLR